MSDKINPKTLSAMSVLLVCIQCAITAGRPICTDANAPPGGDGSSWGTAYKYLQDALADAASDPDPNDIWVACGIYKPDRDTAHPSGTGARTATFGLVSGVAVYGGFPAGGGGWGDRDPQAHETLLSGDVGVVGDHSDNSYHVVTGSGADSTAVLDGFVVSGGRADGPWEDNQDKGAGMYSNNGSPVLTNCTFSENWAQQDGGGMWSNDRDLVLTDCRFGENSAQRDGGGLWNNSRRLTLTNCTFSSNWAGRDGGGMWNKSSRLVVTDCTFNENSAQQDGGAMRNDSSSLTLTDCSFSRNSAGRDGGAMWNQSSSLNVNNCTFTANSAQNNGGGMWNQGSRLTMTNCTFRRNSAGQDGGGMWNEGSRLTVTNSTFIANSAQRNGGGIWNNGSRLTLSRCTFSGNSAGSNGGALYCYYTTTTINNCTFSNNTEDAIWVEGEVARIMGTVRVVSNNLAGSGTLHIEPDATLSLDDSLILCSLSGTGTIQTDIDSELVIKGDAVIDLGDPNDPNANGQLQGGRLLRVEDNVQISNANIDVNQASLEGNTVFTHSKFTIGPLAPYGQFSVDPNVSITYCDFHVYGDRYTDIYPKFFAGEFLNNRLFVTITEGVGQARGGLYECRGDPAFAMPDFAQPCCDPNGFTCCMDPNDIPDCNLRTWTVERMELIKGAKVTLTNRYAFQAPYDPGNDDEVLYVKELILREDSVFNTAYNWAYYGSLQAEPNAVITDVPLLGFSLITIDFNDMLEFIIRVTHNKYEHPTDPALDRQHVTRIEGNEPDPNGMMEMRAIEDLDPNSLTSGQVIAAAAKGTFAKANEEHVLITFEYKFVEDPCDEAELIVYLSDQPGLDVNLVEVARILPPDPNRSGSVTSTELATFSGTFPRGALNFNRGTYVALELRGRGARCWIDDWDPSVSCTKPKCGDYGQPFGSINVIDFLLLLADFGLTNPASVGKGCLDLVGDGCINNDDLLVWDIVEKDNKCPLMLAAAVGPPSAAASSSATVSESQSTAESPPLLVFGKPGGPGPGTPPGYLYGLDSNATCVGEAIEAQGNSRLVTDSLGNVYQINSNVGLMHPDGNVAAAEAVINDGNNLVTIGFNDGDGLLLSDAAFSPDDANIVYVVPVLVTPLVEPGCSYAAAAKLELTGNGNYNLLKLYGKNPATDPDQTRALSVCEDFRSFIYEPDVQHLHEIEVDSHGNVFVLSFVISSDANDTNDNDWLSIYNKAAGNGSEVRVLLSGAGLGGSALKAPSAMVVLSSGEKTYFASSVSSAGDLTTQIHCFSIEKTDSNVTGLTYDGSVDINCPEPDICPTFCDEALGYVTTVTSMTENPQDGTLYVTGFTAPKFAADQPLPPGISTVFTTPMLAAVAPDSNEPVDANQIIASELTLPLSIVWTSTDPNAGTCWDPLECPCQPNGDGTCDGNVNLADLFALKAHFGKCAPWVDPECCSDSNQDGCINLGDLFALKAGFGLSCPAGSTGSQKCP